MRKKLIFGAILVGLLWNLAVYNRTLSYTFSCPNNDCAGLACGVEYTEVINLEGGLPLESATKKSYIIETCYGYEGPSKLEMTVMLAATPQFFINWTILSAPLVGIVYIFTRKKS